MNTGGRAKAGFRRNRDQRAQRARTPRKRGRREGAAFSHETRNPRQHWGFGQTRKRPEQCLAFGKWWTEGLPKCCKNTTKHIEFWRTAFPSCPQSCPHRSQATFLPAVTILQKYVPRIHPSLVRPRRCPRSGSFLGSSPNSFFGSQNCNVPEQSACRATQSRTS